MLDISYFLDKDDDIQFVSTDRYRARNLLVCYFEDNPFIGIDFVAMFDDGISETQVEMAVMKYLADFQVNMKDFSIVFDSKHGDINFIFNFGGEYYNILENRGDYNV